MVWFAARQLPATQDEYVAWIDVMGIGPVMGRSLDGAANFIFKLHAAALEAPHQNMTLYPVMDGLYASTPDQGSLLSFLASVFEKCAVDFVGRTADESLKRFIVRGAVAYGPVIHGSSVPDQAFQPPGNQTNPMSANPAYKNAILMGLPMVQAHEYERQAPPFGIFVHESARAFAPAGSSPLHHVWWKWADGGSATWRALPTALIEHYDWFAQRTLSLEYPADRLEVHRTMAVEYFN